MTTADRAGINDTVGEFNGTARLLPRGDESPRYFMMSRPVGTTHSSVGVHSRAALIENRLSFTLGPNP